jgi:hypothetical protein
MRLFPGRVVIEVFDTHPDPPVPRDVGPEDEAERGLVLVRPGEGVGSLLPAVWRQSRLRGHLRGPSWPAT